jgi:hypothetical protein
MLHPFRFVLLKACHVPLQSKWLTGTFSRLVMCPCISTVTSSDCSLKCQANTVLNTACLRIYEVLIDLFITLPRYIQYTVTEQFWYIC